MKNSLCSCRVRSESPLNGDDLIERLVEFGARRVLTGAVEIIDAGLTLLQSRGLGSERQLVAALLEQGPELADQLLLFRLAADQRAELLDLVLGELPVVVISGARLGILVENETGESGFRPRSVGADVANDERDVVGVPLRRKCPLTGAVRQRDEHHHRHQHESRDQANGRGAPAPPVDP